MRQPAFPTCKKDRKVENENWNYKAKPKRKIKKLEKPNET